jgi:O-acetyl-ADP-ribose deacetylase (regulator of RNase III)
MISKRVFDCLPEDVRNTIEPCDYRVQQVDGSPLSIAGRIQLECEIMSVKFNSKFLVVNLPMDCGGLLGLDILHLMPASIDLTSGKLIPHLESQLPQRVVNVPTDMIPVGHHIPARGVIAHSDRLQLRKRIVPQPRSPLQHHHIYGRPVMRHTQWQGKAKLLPLKPINHQVKPKKCPAHLTRHIPQNLQDRIPRKSVNQGGDGTRRDRQVSGQNKSVDSMMNPELDGDASTGPRNMENGERPGNDMIVSSGEELPLELRKDTLTIQETDKHDYSARGQVLHDLEENEDKLKQTGNFILENGIKVKLLQGNFIHNQTTAWVNPGNEDLTNGGGLARDIAVHMGPKFTTTCEQIIREKKHLKVGEVVCIGISNKPIVLNALGPRWSEYKDKNLCRKRLRQTMDEVFEMASEENCRDLALSCITPGLFGLPSVMVSQVMAESLLALGTEPVCNIKEIHVINLLAKPLQLLQEHLWQGDHDTQVIMY